MDSHVTRASIGNFAAAGHLRGQAVNNGSFQ